MGPNFTNRTTKSVTFQGKLDLPIHRWYRLTPSFLARLAHDIADHFKLSEIRLRARPVQRRRHGPALHEVPRHPGVQRRDQPLPALRRARSRRGPTRTSADRVLLQGVHRALPGRLPTCRSSRRPSDYLKEHAGDIPPINFPERWWSPGNLAQLVCLRRLVTGFKAEPHHLDLVKMAVLGILVPVSNAKHNHVSLTFAENPLPTVESRGSAAAAATQTWWTIFRAVADPRPPR